MKFEELLQCTAHLPLFETGLLLAGSLDPNHIRRQLSRWVKLGKVVQIRRGMYVLAAPYRQLEPHPFYIANQMVRGSYVSLQSALAYYGLIPEYVPVTTSIHMGRPNQWDCPLGTFRFQHIGQELHGHYQVVEIVAGQHVYIAAPEKALLDLVHLTPGSDNRAWLSELRLQNMSLMDVARLRTLAEISRKKKLMRAAELVAILARDEEFVTL